MIEKWFEPFMLLEKQSTPDGLGGQTLTFLDDTPFAGVLTCTCDVPVTAAQRIAVEESPTLLHEYDVTLETGDCIRREKDGAVYRVLTRSDGLRTPAFSGLRFCQVAVERVVFPC